MPFGWWSGRDDDDDDCTTIFSRSGKVFIGDDTRHSIINYCSHKHHGAETELDMYRGIFFTISTSSSVVAAAASGIAVRTCAVFAQ